MHNTGRALGPGDCAVIVVCVYILHSAMVKGRVVLSFQLPAQLAAIMRCLSAYFTVLAVWLLAVLARAPWFQCMLQISDIPVVSCFDMTPAQLV